MRTPARRPPAKRCGGWGSPSNEQRCGTSLRYWPTEGPATEGLGPLGYSGEQARAVLRVHTDHRRSPLLFYFAAVLLGERCPAQPTTEGLWATEAVLIVRKTGFWNPESGLQWGDDKVRNRGQRSPEAFEDAVRQPAHARSGRIHREVTRFVHPLGCVYFNRGGPDHGVPTRRCPESSRPGKQASAKRKRTTAVVFPAGAHLLGGRNRTYRRSEPARKVPSVRGDRGDLG